MLESQYISSQKVRFLWSKKLAAQLIHPIAVMTLSDYMACVLRLSVMPHGRVRQYDDVELLLAEGWVLR